MVVVVLVLVERIRTKRDKLERDGVSLRDGGSVRYVIQNLNFRLIVFVIASEAPNWPCTERERKLFKQIEHTFLNGKKETEKKLKRNGTKAGQSKQRNRKASVYYDQHNIKLY